MKRTVLITRPEEDALPLAETLRARDLQVLIEPMLRIKPIRDATFDVTGVQALLFTSSNGVRAFAALDRRRDIPVITTGEASARVARNLGFKNVEAADGDVTGLVRMVRHRLKPENGPLFHGAGSVVAGELATMLTDAGFDLRREVIYEAVQADALSPQLLQRLSDRQIDMVLLFSPRTAETFVNLVRGLGDRRASVEQGLSGMVALCFSPAVVDAARALPWQHIEAAERPDLSAMLNLIERTNATLDAATANRPETAPVPEPRAAAPVADPRTPDVPDAPTRSAFLTSRRVGGWVWVSAAVIAGFVGLAALATIPAWSPWTDDAPATSGDTYSSAEDDGSMTADTTAVDDYASSGQADDTASESDAGAATVSDPDIASTDDTTASETTASDTTASAATATPDPTEAGVAGALETIPFAAAGLSDPADPASNQVAMVDEPAADPATDPAPATSTDPMDATALESQVPDATPDTTAAEIDALTGRVADIEELLVDFMTEVPAESLADVKAEVQRLIDENAGLRDQLAILTERFEQADATTFMLAVGRLGAALNEGRPFDSELGTLKKLAAADPQLAPANAALDALAPHAATGALPAIRLMAQFPEIARAIVQAAQQDEASAAVDAGEDGWLDRLIGRITGLVTVRPVGADVEGETPAARVARAEAHLQAGDLEAAVGELELLSGAPAEAAASWLAGARARLGVEPAFRILDQFALERLGTASGVVDDVAAGG
jgi:uroporphyrinogen-III synthase